MGTALLASLGAYLRAVARHSTALIGGCAVVVWLGVVERWANKPLSWKYYLALIAVLTISATFKAWREERENRLSAEAKMAERPQPTLFFNPSDPQNVATRSTNGYQFTTEYAVGVRNPGGRRADAVIVVLSDYAPRETLRSGNGRTIIGMPFHTEPLSVSPDPAPPTYIRILTHWHYVPREGFALPDPNRKPNWSMEGSAYGVESTRCELVIGIKSEYRSPPLRLKFSLPTDGAPTAEVLPLDAPSDLVFASAANAAQQR